MRLMFLILFLFACKPAEPETTQQGESTVESTGGISQEIKLSPNNTYALYNEFIQGVVDPQTSDEYEIRDLVRTLRLNNISTPHQSDWITFFVGEIINLEKFIEYVGNAVASEEKRSIEYAMHEMLSRTTKIVKNNHLPSGVDEETKELREKIKFTKKSYLEYAYVFMKYYHVDWDPHMRHPAVDKEKANVLINNATRYKEHLSTVYSCYRGENHSDCSRKAGGQDSLLNDFWSMLALSEDDTGILEKPIHDLYDYYITNCDKNSSMISEAACDILENKDRALKY